MASAKRVEGWGQQRPPGAGLHYTISFEDVFLLHVLKFINFIEEFSDTYAVFIMNSVNGRELTQYGIRKYDSLA